MNLNQKPQCPKMSQSLLSCINLYQALPGHTGPGQAMVSRAVPDCTRLCQTVPNRATLCQAVPGCASQAAVAAGDIRWQIEGCPWLISSRWPCLPSGAWAGPAAPPSAASGSVWGGMAARWGMAGPQIPAWPPDAGWGG